MKPTILLIEDTPFEADAVIGPLTERGFEVTWAADGTSGIRLAHDVSPACILLDVQLPDIDGYSVCRLLAARPATKDIPVIMLTTKAAVEDRIKGFDTGAADYLPKPFDAGELEARIMSCVRAKALQDEVREKNRELESLLSKFQTLATTDELTGLFNRRRFFDELEKELSRFERYGSPLALLMIDIDYFKRVNDTHGHSAGDAVLRGVGVALAEVFRRTDTVARFGGEEFAVLLPEASVADAVEAGERLRVAVEERAFPAGTAALAVTVSVGVATATAELKSPESVINAADSALYRAKELGRNRVEVARQSVHNRAEER